MLRCRSHSPSAAKRRRRACELASPAPTLLGGGKRGHGDCWDGSEADVPPPPARSKRRLVRRDTTAQQHGAAQVRSRACLGRGCDHDFVGESFGAFDMGEGLEGLGVAVALSNALILAALIMAASGAAGVLLGCVFSGLSAVRGLGVGLAGGALFLTQMFEGSRVRAPACLLN
mmetsp:Transcript_81634/g.221155  ORF Transcript_81634/g.221155 Transcript_81634/m.221155 type:complete len:173 (-) Transcript_81634:158-676(-)